MVSHRVEGLTRCAVARMASLSYINSGLQLLRALKVNYAVVPRDAAVGHEQSLANGSSTASNMPSSTGASKLLAAQVTALHLGPLLRAERNCSPGLRDRRSHFKAWLPAATRDLAATQLVIPAAEDGTSHSVEAAQKGGLRGAVDDRQFNLWHDISALGYRRTSTSARSATALFDH